ncbi:MAG: hypothetical protein ABSH19_01465 [Opitutales bacterium]
MAAEFIFALPPRRQRRVLDLAHQLAEDPFLRSDYTLPDAMGRPIEHLLMSGYVLTYWVDHAERLVMITEVDAAE